MLSDLSARSKRSLGCRPVLTIFIKPRLGTNEAHKLPAPGAREGVLLRLGIEAVKQVWFQLDEEQHSGAIPFAAPQASQCLASTRISRWTKRLASGAGMRWHDRAVLLAVAAGDDRGARRQFVLADPAFQAELEQGDLHHGHGRRKLSRLMRYCSVLSVGGRKAGGAQRVRPNSSRQGIPRRSTGSRSGPRMSR